MCGLRQLVCSSFSTGALSPIVLCTCVLMNWNWIFNNNSIYYHPQLIVSVNYLKMNHGFTLAWWSVVCCASLILLPLERVLAPHPPLNCSWYTMSSTNYQLVFSSTISFSFYPMIIMVHSYIVNNPHQYTSKELRFSRYTTITAVVMKLYCNFFVAVQ